MKNIDKYRGCLIGGACGDALGYPVEFLSTQNIISRYGARGITDYELTCGLARISDDTQMTLFTATGLLFATTRGMLRGILGSYESYIGLHYKDWYRTQTERYPLREEFHNSWLLNLPELFSRRAPGNTCLASLSQQALGTMQKPINQSKGCGGVMRVAPIGLYFEGEYNTIEEADRVGAASAALTHGHPLGYIPAAALVHLVHRLSHNDDMTLPDAVLDMRRAMEQQFATNAYLKDFLHLVDHALSLSQDKSICGLDAIRALGEGWVAEEALAIAIFCALRYPTDFERALIVSVNHDGDSDSTGAITGNILGAHLGLQGIPWKYVEPLELRDVICALADDLYYDCQMTEAGTFYDEIWMRKYVKNCYPH